jgi:hypothetical protein
MKNRFVDDADKRIEIILSVKIRPIRVIREPGS